MFWAQIRKCYNLLEASDKRKFLFLTFFMSFLGVLDLIGVTLLGVLSLLLFDTGSSNFFQSLLPPGLLTFFVENLYFLAMFISFLFLFKSIALIFLSKFEFSFLAKAQTKISLKFARLFYRQPVDRIMGNSSDKVAFNLTYGIDSAITVILSSVSVFVADLVLIFILSIPLYMFDTPLAIFSFVYFGFLAFIVLRFVAPIAHAAGLSESHKNVEVTTLIKNISTGFREINTSFKLDRFFGFLEARKFSASKYFGLRLFLQQIPKFVFELSLIVGAIMFVVIKGSTAAPANEIATSIIVFVAAAFRLAPSLLRLQSAAIVIKSNIGIAASTIDFTDFLRDAKSTNIAPSGNVVRRDNFIPEVSVSDLSFCYRDSRASINNLSFAIPANTSFAIVGESGAGKSTLMDCMLGLLTPSSGSVVISGMNPQQAITIWPNSISYLPQQVTLLDASVRENIHLDFGVSGDSDDEIFRILDVVLMKEFVSTLPDGLDTRIGENGAKLSGGEKQRIGLARVLFSKPRILFLDEATSSLDPVTEMSINSALSNITEFATVVVIAHRLSTIRNFDQILFLDQGNNLGIGTFEQLRSGVPSFKQQCDALGL